ncbi:MAG: tetratricopeptide repeat protein [Desulfuromonadaceae bacterium]|nr:tetratricopeptide repeat protein [Desulfuromonadaceae bacterium]
MDVMRAMQARQKYEALEKTLQSLSPEAATEQITLFMQEFPDYAQAHNDLAVLLHQQGELLPALGRFERAVRLAPQNSTYRKNLAGFYFVELGWTDDAILMYTELLRERPDDTEVLGALALISSRINRPEEAGHFLRKILDLEPWNNDARSMLNSLVPSTVTAVPVIIPPTPAPDAAPGDVDTLLAELRQSVAALSAPQTPSAPIEVHVAEAVKDARITELENRLRDDPTNALINNDLGVLYLEAGNPERSCDHHELAFRYAPQNLLFRKNLAGVCAISEGKMDRAIELLTGGLRDYPADTEILAALAQVCIRLGRNEEAIIFLKRILDIEPWNQDARSLLTQLQQSFGDSFFLNS